MRLGKTATLLFGSKIIRSVAGFIATLYIARVLGSQALGVYSIGLAITFWAALPSTAIASGIVKRVSESNKPRKMLTAGFLLNFGIAAVLAIAAWAVRSWINLYVGASVGALIAILLSGHILFTTLSSILQGQKRIVTAGIAKMAEQVLRTGLQIVFLILGYRIVGVFFGHIMSIAIGTIVGFLLIRSDFSVPDFTHFNAILSYARYSWIESIRGKVFGSLDTLVLAFFTTASLVGIYQAAWNLASILIMASLAIQQTTFPEFSDLATSEDYDQIRRHLDESLIFIGVLAIPGFFGSLVIGRDVLQIYGPEFAKGGIILAILILARTVFSFAAQFINVINGLDRPDLSFRISLVFILMNLALNVTIVPVVGWYGAAIATTISAFAALILSYRTLIGLLGPLSIPYYEISVEVLVAGGMAMIVYAFSSVVFVDLMMTVGLVLFGASIYLIGILSLSARIRSKIFLLVNDLYPTELI